MVITGVIRPPPEIRAVADRTASYVAKNGRAFEARILNSAKGKTPKFAFLQPTSPFHAYYEDRIHFFETGGDEKEKENEEKEKAAAVAKGKADKEKASSNNKTSNKETIRKKEKMQKASAIDPIAKALLAQRSKISKPTATSTATSTNESTEAETNEATIPICPPPPLELVTIVAPSNLSPTQIETVQLVAQFTAMDGRGGPFLHHLTVREWNNPDFSFCQPRHAYFAYFSALVDAYRKIFATWTQAASTKSLDSIPKEGDQQVVLAEAAYRAEYERHMEQRTTKEDGEIIAIDWQDFVVVETIDFPVTEVVELSMLPPPPPPPQTTVTMTTATTAASAAGQEDAGMDESDDDEEEETIRVVPSYTPKVVGPRNPLEARAIDPITGKSVSVADMPEHMRIQLLDPKWAEERKKFQEKQKDSNLVGGDAIVNNISRFTQARGDLFGKSEQELLSQEKDSKRRLEESNRVMREQAYQQAHGQHHPPGASAVGPSLPMAPATSNEPASKRMRMDPKSIPPPPPPPPPMATATTSSAAPPRNQMQTSGDPMADAMLTNNTAENDSTATLLAEAEFAATLSKPEVTLQIRIPNDPSQMAWNFYGQILSMTVNVMSKVKAVKTELSRLHLNNMPANKIQFKDPQTGSFLKDNMTLAALNVGPTATVDLRLKTRGGRK